MKEVHVRYLGCFEVYIEYESRGHGFESHIFDSSQRLAQLDRALKVDFSFVSRIHKIYIEGVLEVYMVKIIYYADKFVGSTPTPGIRAGVEQDFYLCPSITYLEKLSCLERL